LIREELKIGPRGGERLRKQRRLSKEKSVEKLFSLLRIFHRRMNHISRRKLWIFG